MISWTKIADDNWLVRWDGKVKKLNDQMKVILWTLVLMEQKETDKRKLKNHINEVEYAMLEMIKCDHNYVEFGLFNTFVYSDRIGNESETSF